MGKKGENVILIHVMFSVTVCSSQWYLVSAKVNLTHKSLITIPHFS